MKKEIIIEASEGQLRAALMEDGRLAEIFFDTPDKDVRVGSIYLGRVQRVIQGMNAAFVDIGLEQDAFLHFSDVSSATEEFSDLLVEEDEDDEETDTPPKPKPSVRSSRRPANPQARQKTPRTGDSEEGRPRPPRNNNRSRSSQRGKPRNGGTGNDTPDERNMAFEHQYPSLSSGPDDNDRYQNDSEFPEADERHDISDAVGDDSSGERSSQHRSRRGRRPRRTRNQSRKGIVAEGADSGESDMPSVSDDVVAGLDEERIQEPIAQMDEPPVQREVREERRANNRRTERPVANVPADAEESDDDVDSDDGDDESDEATATGEDGGDKPRRRRRRGGRRHRRKKELRAQAEAAAAAAGEGEATVTAESVEAVSAPEKTQSEDPAQSTQQKPQRERPPRQRERRDQRKSRSEDGNDENRAKEPDAESSATEETPRPNRRNNRENRDNREGRESRDNRENRESRESRDNRENRDSREGSRGPKKDSGEQPVAEAQQRPARRERSAEPQNKTQERGERRPERGEKSERRPERPERNREHARPEAPASRRQETAAPQRTEGAQRRPESSPRQGGGKPATSLPTFFTKRAGEITIGLERDQDVVVQVTREPYASKGVRVTTRVSLPGRFLVLLPLDDVIGVSRKILQHKDRRRLYRIARSILPQGYGCIIRTVAQDKDEQVIREDLTSLIDKWKVIEKKLKASKAPAFIHEDSSIANTIVRDLLTPDISRVVINDKQLFRQLRDYIEWAAPSLANNVELYSGTKPIFEKFGIERELEKAIQRKVYIPSGGYVILEQTEAMMVIDVNSGRYADNREQEMNALRTNMESAREIARQLRLRDIGGLVVVDFIDLYDEKNRKKIYDELRREMRRDRAKSVVLPMTQFGLVQITRQRIRQQIAHSMSEPCPTCSGSGMVQPKSMVINRIERWLESFKSSKESRPRKLELLANPVIVDHLTHGTISPLAKMMLKYRVLIKAVPDDKSAFDTFRVLSSRKQEDLTEQFMN